MSGNDNRVIIDSTGDNTEKLLNIFIEHYMSNIFYYCLKKTGDKNDADELVSDISLCVVDAINKGIIPDNFGAYVWKIAKNRYYRWVKERAKQKSIMIDNMELLEQLPNDCNLEDQIIEDEQTKLLRRELAFLPLEYIHIVEEYYLKGKKTSEVAKTLNIPQGTVFTKLTQIRKMIRKGMSMTRVFGRRSYNPEIIKYIFSGNVSEEKWGLVDRKLATNIICEAYGSPRSVLDLAMELGIAVPYMEDEVSILQENGILKAVEGNQYVTDLIFLSKKAQDDINSIRYDYVFDVCDNIWALGEKAADYLHLNAKDDDVLIITFLIELLSREHTNNKPYLKKGNGMWDMYGVELGASSPISVTPYYCNNYYFQKGNAYVKWSEYTRDIYSYPQNALKKAVFVPDEKSALTIKKIKSNSNSEGLLAENEMLQRMIDEGIVEKAEDNYHINALVLSHDELNTLNAYICESDEFNWALKKLKTTKECIAKRILQDIPDYLSDYIPFVSALQIDSRELFAGIFEKKKLYKSLTPVLRFIEY